MSHMIFIIFLGEALLVCQFTKFTELSSLVKFIYSWYVKTEVLLYSIRNGLYGVSVSHKLKFSRIF